MTEQRQTDMERLVVVRAGLDGRQAQMLKANLEGQGVPAFLSREHEGNIQFINNTSLYVKAKDWGVAEQVLSKVELMPQRAALRDADGEERSCPHCGSHRLHGFVGEVPTLIPFIKLKADVGDQWFHCLECDSYHQAVRKRFAGLPFALAWAAFMGALALSVIIFINWLKYL